MVSMGIVKLSQQGFWFVSETRQNGLQNNWLLRAYIANIQEIQQHLPSIQGIISHTKDRHKMCDHPKIF